MNEHSWKSLPLERWTEYELFHFLKATIYPDLEIIDLPYSFSDCMSMDKEDDIELKCRKKHYDNMLIEKIKYDRLINRAKHSIKRPIYICSTPKGVWKWNLFNQLIIVWQNKDDLPVTTEFENNNRIEKEVGFLDYCNAECLYLEKTKPLKLSLIKLEEPTWSVAITGRKFAMASGTTIP